MTRHIIDHPTTSPVTSHANAALRRCEKDANTPEHSKILDRPRQIGNGRLVQYLEIERGRRV
ncbi:hypothetical protein L0664_10025 [Octadecabacter sp. G9-8]|uniref:Uncharacterized protein n=1 Tax=Octadecabacter dasysiphoniae TaxID=2909341 RepID=A0ABS9CVZ6_9RHOB|nr:hypothetical protein [Octadecabacter dasysiphoniae]MCF2871399.1 hypothetical protein [Octadecabacter dasysiphoniae]